ncbi:hypothetical protein ACJZ2D_016490 [Fusarium nematophilum]
MTASVLAILVAVTGALAAPGSGPPPPPPPPHHPPPPPAPPVKQENTCGNGQSLYCCATNGKNSDVTCNSFTNGGIGGVCNGIQMCCNNNQGTQGCNFAVGGGTIVIIKKEKKKTGW